MRELLMGENDDAGGLAASRDPRAELYVVLLGPRSAYPP